MIGTGSFIPNYKKPDSQTGQSPLATPFWGVAASGAQVEVDIETGDFKIMKLINVADVGVALNPQLVKVQLSGAGIMQLGFTTTEEMTYRDGQLTNGSLSDYKIPTLLELPLEFINEHVKARQEDGPFGAKGAGEKHNDRLVAGHRKCGGRRYRCAHYRSSYYTGEDLPRIARGKSYGRRGGLRWQAPQHSFYVQWPERFRGGSSG